VGETTQTMPQDVAASSRTFKALAMSLGGRWRKKNQYHSLVTPTTAHDQGHHWALAAKALKAFCMSTHDTA